MLFRSPSQVLDGVHAKITELNGKILPKGMKVETYYDRSDLVGLTLSTVHGNLLHGFLLVVGVVWLFLRSMVGSAIVGSVIPLSLLVAFGLGALLCFALGPPYAGQVMAARGQDNLRMLNLYMDRDDVAHVLGWAPEQVHIAPSAIGGGSAPGAR